MRCSTRVGSGLTHKYLTRKKKLALDKHTSLLGHSVMDKDKVLSTPCVNVVKLFSFH